MGGGFALAITDGDFKVIAASSRAEPWQGKSLEDLIAAGQPLFMFGERAGVMDVVIDGEAYYAAVHSVPGAKGSLGTKTRVEGLVRLSSPAAAGWMA